MAYTLYELGLIFPVFQESININKLAYYLNVAFIDKSAYLRLKFHLFVPNFYLFLRNLRMKRTFQPSKIKRARTHGFRARMATVGGRNVIRSRRAKGRHTLAL